MTAPTASDGVVRALKEMAAPPIGIFLAVVFTEAFIGGFAAGIVYLLLKAGVALGIYQNAVHWNIGYTLGYSAAGLVLLGMVPGIGGMIIHPVFGVLGTLITLVGLGLVIFLLIEKLELDEFS